MTANEHSTTGEPRSYWHATAPPPVPADELPDGADVVVVGGGLIGCWTAYWLARAGVAVTLIERTAISWGATGRNGGFTGIGSAEGYLGTIARIGHEGARGVWQITLESRHLLRRVLAEEGIVCDYREPGKLALALSDEDMAGIRRSAEAMVADGFTSLPLDRQQVQMLIRTPLSPEIIGGAYAPEHGSVHSARLIAGVALAAQRHGARLCAANVERVAPLGDGVLVQTSRGAVRAGAAVVAVNAWSDELVPAVEGVITPVRGQVITYESVPTVFTTGVNASVTPTGEYWQQTPDGTLLLGGCRADAPGADVGIREPVPTPPVQAALERVYPRLFPQLAGLRVSRRWAGLMAFTPDYLPIADQTPDGARIWFAGGLCGHGMPFGPRLGQLLAEAASSGATPAALAPLRLRRPSLESVQA